MPRVLVIAPLRSRTSLLSCRAKSLQRNVKHEARLSNVSHRIPETPRLCRAPLALTIIRDSFTPKHGAHGCAIGTRDFQRKRSKTVNAGSDRAKIK